MHIYSASMLVCGAFAAEDSVDANTKSAYSISKMVSRSFHICHANFKAHLLNKPEEAA